MAKVIIDSVEQSLAPKRIALGSDAFICFDLRPKLRPAKAEVRAGAARLYDRNADLERAEFLSD